MAHYPTATCLRRDDISKHSIVNYKGQFIVLFGMRSPTKITLGDCYMLDKVLISYLLTFVFLWFFMNKINLAKYHELALYLRQLAVDAQSSGRNYCLADTQVLCTVSAAMDNLILKITEALSVISTFSSEGKNEAG